MDLALALFIFYYYYLGCTNGSARMRACGRTVSKYLFVCKRVLYVKTSKKSDGMNHDYGRKEEEWFDWQGKRERERRR